VDSNSPLADQLRPKIFLDFVGQEHLVGKNGILTRLIGKDQLPSIIFWGPPGCGKTTLARLIATQTKSFFIHFSAVTSGVAEVKKIVLQAKERVKLYAGQRTILFVDEIHRFNKLQQDAFLPFVEDGTIILFGATTENPSFEIIGPLLSRCRVFVLEALNQNDLIKIIDRTLKELKLTINDKAKSYLVESANGDARIAINVLEIVSKIVKKTIKIKDIEDALQKKALLYDKGGEEHYNTISAFIKSMRASDPDAALYYLARMVNAGEDPLFIARRMVVFASEDIGMAQPTALVVANEVFRACETIGFPECQENLAHGAVYLCLAKKDRAAVDAYFKALEDVKKLGNLPIPLLIRNAPTKLMKDLGYGRDYEPYHDKIKSFLPDELKGKKYY